MHNFAKMHMSIFFPLIPFDSLVFVHPVNVYLKYKTLYSGLCEYRNSVSKGQLVASSVAGVTIKQTSWH